MADQPPGPITELLAASARGDSASRERLFEAVYEELRRIANAQMRHAPGRTLQPTALVHEAYLRLYGGEAQPIFASRRHFFAAAAKAMRHIMVDDVRRRGRLKRGGPGALAYGSRAGEPTDPEAPLRAEASLSRTGVSGDEVARSVGRAFPSEEPIVFDQDPGEVLAIDEALTRLDAVSPRAAKVVELRFFGGFTVDETAEALGISPRCVDKDWHLARVWLHRELSAGLTS